MRIGLLTDLKTHGVEFLARNGFGSFELLIWPAACFGLVLLTLQRSSAAGAWIGLAPTIFIIVFSLVFYIEHRKTTPAFGYLFAMSGVAAAALVERNAAHH